MSARDLAERVVLRIGDSVVDLLSWADQRMAGWELTVIVVVTGGAFMVFVLLATFGRRA